MACQQCSHMIIFFLVACLVYANAQSFLFPAEKRNHQLPNTIRHHNEAPPQKLALSGGLLHTAGLYLKAKVGGQDFTLQVDISYASIIVPRKGCKGCRVGDHRYDPSQSRTSTAIPCDDQRCKAETDQCHSKQCFHCSSNGNCCVEGKDECAFNMFYGDGSSGNGTLFTDSFEIAKLQTDMLFGTMHEESHNFELPYADGVLGLAMKKGACHPNCIQPAMDALVDQTGIQNAFTLCVSRFGGTLVLGGIDNSLATKPFQYVKLDALQDDHRYITPAASRWKIGDKQVDLPDITTALWTLGTSNIGLSKQSFMAIIEHLMENYCSVPGLCTVSSWFRPEKCVHIEDKYLKMLPDFTIPITNDVSITLKPEDYLIKYRIIQGKQLRCVAFIATDSLAKKGIGLILGSTVMRRYAVAFDREKKQIGVALADDSKCGPKNGTNSGLPVPTMGSGQPILTADSPSVSPNKTDANIDLQEALETAEKCRAENSCGGCSKQSKCSFSYRTGRCIPSSDAYGHPYPYCSGISCVCFAVGASGWYVGIALGVLLGIVVVSVVSILYRRRKRRTQYEAVQQYEEQDLETF